MEAFADSAGSGFLLFIGACVVMLVGLGYVGFGGVDVGVVGEDIVNLRHESATFLWSTEIS